jgi:hypothetical protein
MIEKLRRKHREIGNRQKLIDGRLGVATETTSQPHGHAGRLGMVCCSSIRCQPSYSLASKTTSKGSQYTSMYERGVPLYAVGRKGQREKLAEIRSFVEVNLRLCQATCQLPQRDRRQQPSLSLPEWPMEQPVSSMYSDRMVYSKYSYARNGARKSSRRRRCSPVAPHAKLRVSRKGSLRWLSRRSHLHSSPHLRVGCTLVKTLGLRVVRGQNIPLECQQLGPRETWLTACGEGLAQNPMPGSAVSIRQGWRVARQELSHPTNNTWCYRQRKRQLPGLLPTIHRLQASSVFTASMIV